MSVKDTGLTIFGTLMFNRPTLLEINDRITADFKSWLQATGAFLRRAVILVFARVLAGASHLMHGHLVYISRQIIPDTAETAYLERWASIWGIFRKPATFASGVITMTGADGSLIPALSLFVRSDQSQYSSTADATIASGTASVTVQALVAGSLGEADAATELNLVSPIAGVDSTGVVDVNGLTGGNDAETDDELRGRLIERIGNPPLGGAVNDYVKWAQEVPGVTRAWCYEEYNGPGTVGVTFVRDNDASIIPDGSEVTEVADHIETVRPVTAHVTVFAPTSDPIDFTIHISPDTPAIRAAVQAELEDMIFRDAEPGGAVLLSHMNEAISIAAGENDHSLTNPVADYVSASGHIAQMGMITWV